MRVRDVPTTAEEVAQFLSERATIVGDNCPTCGQPVILSAVLQKTLEQLSKSQIPLPADMAKVWDDNIDKLYES